MLYLRTAAPEDAEALRAIYAPYVTDTAITFEYDVPTLAEFRQRMETTLTKYPYLVAERDGEVLGYAYAGALGQRAAYGWSAETSIYLRQDCRRMGLGSRLYDALEAQARRQNIQTLYACIAASSGENDPYLTRASIAFHTDRGYRTVAHFHRCGYKFDRWYDLVWMEKPLGDYSAPPAPFIPFPQAAGCTPN